MDLQATRRQDVLVCSYDKATDVLEGVSKLSLRLTGELQISGEILLVRVKIAFPPILHLN